MVEETITDGKRIAQLLASEITGRETGPLAAMAVVDADPDVEPTADGAVAYGVDRDGERVADVAVQPERAYLELRTGVDAGADAAADADLRVRPKAVEPPRTLVFVESGAAVKAAVDVLVAAAEAES
ncbi:hypothetical protein SAMN05216388_1001111 [Halorientalis persicus]|jgi:hypothetical protein|uniref:DUF7993 domain-containing protein n=1 Tax=Halorientalis persicus TaxID=1367881 RepID=A0A1H8CZP6_9EURY|nr:hypothetical protein [Halorientalis persicus]SEM99697.1 hypothetical protein SAMN05216388_1001111 [Halorientalis persicus]